jgi:hypothetical protein
MNTQTFIRSILILLLFSLIFIGSLYTPVDPDLGWELKYGQYFIQNHQVLKTNIFSTLMPNFYWVNHSWLADVILYIIFNSFGFFGLTLAGAFVVSVLFYIFSKVARLSFIQQIILLPILLYLESALNMASLRPQLMSLFLLGILIYILTKYENGSKKILFLTIPLLSLWANIHGEFILGLGILFLWILSSVIKKLLYEQSNNDRSIRKEILFLGGIFIVSGLAVLINPFGFGVYTETLKHFFNPNLQYIIEWHPFPLFSQDWWNLLIVGILFLSSLFILKSTKKIEQNFTMIVITCIFFIFSFFSRRYLWPFYYLALPFLGIILAQFSSLLDKYAFQISYGIFIVLSIVVVISKSPFDQFPSMTWESYCKIRKCSAKAAQFIIDHQLNENPHLLTLYDLGGWLIWNFPQIKPTIDGRMTLWMDENGNTPFAEYLAYEQTMKDIDLSDYNVVFGPITKPVIKRLLDLEKEGKWKPIYYDAQNDPYVVIFERVHTPQNGPVAPL